MKARLFLIGLVLLGLAMVGPRLGDPGAQSEPVPRTAWLLWGGLALVLVLLAALVLRRRQKGMS